MGTRLAALTFYPDSTLHAPDEGNFTTPPCPVCAAHPELIPEPCIFCWKTPKYEDEFCKLFRSYAEPEGHYLVVTHQHIPSYMDKQFSRELLVKMMKCLQDGFAFLHPRCDWGKLERVGFHIPGHTSVQHIHLHALLPGTRASKKNEWKWKLVRRGGILQTLDGVVRARGWDPLTLQELGLQTNQR